MTLNENAPLARLYRWFYLDKSMPNSLCPYFWKLVLMWIFIIPYILLCLPNFIFTYLTKDADDRDFGARLAISIIMWIGLWIVSALIVAFISFFVNFQPESELDLFAKIGYIFWGLIIYTILNVFHNQYIEKKNKGIKSEPKVSIVKEFIKAKYNKYCPKIDWK